MVNKFNRIFVIFILIISTSIFARTPLESITSVDNNVSSIVILQPLIPPNTTYDVPTPPVTATNSYLNFLTDSYDILTATNCVIELYDLSLFSRINTITPLTNTTYDLIHGGFTKSIFPLIGTEFLISFDIYHDTLLAKIRDSALNALNVGNTNQYILLKNKFNILANQIITRREKLNNITPTNRFR